MDVDCTSRFLQAAGHCQRAFNEEIFRADLVMKMIKKQKHSLCPFLWAILHLFFKLLTHRDIIAQYMFYRQ